MAEPSNTVQPQLLPHVHLIVSVNQPHQPQQLPLDRALDMLMRAPQLVRNNPVSWQYLRAPNDGTLLFAWQPITQLGQNYASDGYVWSGAEQIFPQTFSNCTIQIFVQEAGFIPGNEQFTLHRRIRYRVVSSPNGGHDPALELVHYTASFPEHQIPVNRVTPSHQIQKQIQERVYLEKQGSLQRKQFMLHDKASYPPINVPQNPLPGNPYQAASMYGRGPMPRPQQQVPGARGPLGPSPSKRPQPVPPRMMGGHVQPHPFAGTQQMPEFLLDEENHAYGDALDFLTPREISSARYKQHHEWMEEILSSPYGLSQIMPVNLGLKLYGELGTLTEGLWSERKQEDRAEGTPAYDGGLNKDNVAEFEKRVREFVTKGEEELAAGRERHGAKMEEMSQQKLFAKLERRLAESSGTEGLEEVVAEAEEASGLKIRAREAAVQIEKGGMLEKVEGPEYGAEATQQQQTNQEFADFADMDTAGEALDFFDNMDYSAL